MPKVSVIVPVYNPGSHIDDCIGSLLGQTLDDVELVFVDDGSTDGTPARLDALAAEHPHVKVEHIPNSGWPGRPRNVGLGIAQGEYVFFADNDDWLGEEALERLYGTAKTDDADVVVGKVVGHGKTVPRALFRANQHGIEFEPMLLGLLTPHKLFRRALLDEHGIRFPEGRRRLEDHPFVVESYFRARRISVVADYPCYHWVLRDPDVNASARQFDAEGYYENVREVLDLVERRTEPGPFRDRLLTHWYRGKMLGRVGGGGFLDRDPAYQRELFDSVRELALERFGEDVHERLPFHLRVRSRLLRDGAWEAIQQLARLEAGLSPSVKLRSVQGPGSHLAIVLESRLGQGRRPALAFRQEGERLRWEPPAGPLRDALAGVELDVTDELRSSRVQVWLHNAADESQYVLPARTEVKLRSGAAPGLVRPVLITHVPVAPTTAAAGAPLPAGQWELRTSVNLAGFSGARRVRRSTKLPLILTSFPPGRVVAGQRPPQIARPGSPAGLLSRVVRRTRAAAGGIARG